MGRWKLAAGLAVLVAAGLPLHAQEFIAPLPEGREIVPMEIQEPRPSIEGIVRDIFTIRKPWQLINPAAPASYGSGEKRVSKDFGPGTPVHSQGVVVLGVEW